MTVTTSDSAEYELQIEGLCTRTTCIGLISPEGEHDEDM